MFKSGFVIFLVTRENLFSPTNCTSLSVLYKQIVINNKINLINITFGKFQDVFANVGGVMGVIQIFFSFFVDYFATQTL